MVEDMDKGLKELEKWLNEGIINFRKDSELGKNAREQRIIAYTNVLNKIAYLKRKNRNSNG